MMYVYSRLLDPAMAALAGPADAGWLVGVSARGLPHRRAWIDHAGRASSGGSDIWRDMAFAAPAPRRRLVWPQADQDAYILQQDPSGLWSVDPWADSVGTIRAVPSAQLANTAHGTQAAGSGRDLANACFIIELEHATRR